MSAAREQPGETSSASKLTRSRNGCNECRRLHRRCDETKPCCLNCVEAGKSLICSYQKRISWGGRQFRRSTFGTALSGSVVEVPISASEEDPQPHSADHAPFIYGLVEDPSSTSDRSRRRASAPRSRSAPEPRSDNESENTSWQIAQPESHISPLSVAWLSDHHRSLLGHFVDSTVTLFSENEAVCAEIRSAIIPQAVNTNHGFSLLAALLSLASTHRFNLGMHRDTLEAEYWRDMSVGHLRRPTFREDGSTREVAIATALMLCVREVISNNEMPSAWKLHLHAAFTLLRSSDHQPHSGLPQTFLLLKSIARSLQIRSLLPTTISSPSPGDSDAAQHQEANDASVSTEDITIILGTVRSLRFERNALHNIESNSDSSNMQPLWAALRGRCLELVVRLRAFIDKNTPLSESSIRSDQLYGYAALVQLYSAVLDLPPTDAGLRNLIETATGLFGRALASSDYRISADLLFPLFTIGCLVRPGEDRGSIRLLMNAMAEKLGKGNARLAAAFLEELWTRVDKQGRLAKQEDVDTIIVEKGWELSLW